MNQNLTDLFLKKKNQAASADRIDWDERRNKFVAAVENLYHQIEKILAEPIEKETVKLSRRNKNLTENYMGTYAVDDLLLVIGDEQVRFSPQGRNIAGSSGRVDVQGERGEEILIVQADGRWRFVQSRHPTLRVVEFNESSFAEVLELVMRD